MAARDRDRSGRRAQRGGRGLPALVALLLLAALAGAPPGRAQAPGAAALRPADPYDRYDPYLVLRQRMVDEQIRRRDVSEPAVLAAMEQVPRHLFVPEAERGEAYRDTALPIGEGQTISQPYIVALMTSLLDAGRGARVLEIGTGSGYHAAVLAHVAGEVYTIEIVPALADRARRTLGGLGYGNVHVRTGDGYRGWPEEAPFDAILLTAAPREVPPPLLAQLKPGGRLVAPLGASGAGAGPQELEVLTKRADGGVDTRRVLPCRFVPMTGEAESRR
jgi:protein-L-isoaspartate(D-aspartate) O-methyltransferase